METKPDDIEQRSNVQNALSICSVCVRHNLSVSASVHPTSTCSTTRRVCSGFARLLELARPSSFHGSAPIFGCMDLHGSIYLHETNRPGVESPFTTLARPLVGVVSAPLPAHRLTLDRNRLAQGRLWGKHTNNKKNQPLHDVSKMRRVGRSVLSRTAKPLAP